MPLLHPTDQSGSSLGVHTEVTSTWRARGVDRGGFPVAILSGLVSGHGVRDMSI